MSTNAAKTLVHAFVSSRLDYCNELLHGISEELMCHVQNATVRLVTGALRRDLITPILRQLHWLPVRQRVQFKITVLVFPCLSANKPTYLADRIVPSGVDLWRQLCPAKDTPLDDDDDDLADDRQLI